jgi:porphobilinogen deaminase
MEEIDMDLHDDDSSYDTELEALVTTSDNVFDAPVEKIKMEKELIFYRRLDEY